MSDDLKTATGTCQSCGVPWEKHPGIMATCAALQEQRLLQSRAERESDPTPLTPDNIPSLRMTPLGAYEVFHGIAWSDGRLFHPFGYLGQCKTFGDLRTWARLLGVTLNEKGGE